MYQSEEQSVYCILPLTDIWERSYNTSFKRLMDMFLAPLTS